MYFAPNITQRMEESKVIYVHGFKRVDLLGETTWHTQCVLLRAKTKTLVLLMKEWVNSDTFWRRHRIWAVFKLLSQREEYESQKQNGQSFPPTKKDKNMERKKNQSTHITRVKMPGTRASALLPLSHDRHHQSIRAYFFFFLNQSILKNHTKFQNPSKQITQKGRAMRLKCLGLEARWAN